MDETTAAEIRRWAWEQTSSQEITDEFKVKDISRADRMNTADELAAWVMSSRLPEPVQPATDQ